MPSVFLTKSQKRSSNAEEILRNCVNKQKTTIKALAKQTGIPYPTMIKRFREPETCTLEELWKILDALDAQEDERKKILA